MNKKLTTLAFFTASFVLLSGFHGGCGSRDPAKRVERAERMALSHVEEMLEEVDANEAQTKRILGHTRAVTKEAIAIHQTHQGTKKLLLDQWNAPTPDAELIHRTIDERVDTFKRFLHGVADALIDTHQTLTPEQRRQIVEELH